MYAVFKIVDIGNSEIVLFYRMKVWEIDAIWQWDSSGEIIKVAFI